jgi:defect-in-organelle-trafficking protein DotC
MPRPMASIIIKPAFIAGALPGLLLALLLAAAPLHAEDPEGRDAPSPPPPSLGQIESTLKIQDEVDDGGLFDSGEDKEEKDKTRLGLQIREDALKEAAMSYGARGGLSWRTFQIQRRLAENEGNITSIFNFGHLLIAAPSGLLIEPPVVTEAQKAVLVSGGGQSAAVADRVYRINRNARIVTAPRNWRAYLERDWGKVDAPPQILQPKNDSELQQWRKWLSVGWEEGLRQADDVFQADLDRLNTDYLGMIRYRELLAQGMITPPYASQEDRGVTGGGGEMRIGDRALTITGPSQLNPKAQRWITAPR